MKKNAKKFAQSKKKLYLCNIIKKQTTMTKEFTTNQGEMKCSVNIRAHRVSVSRKIGTEWCRYKKSIYLCKSEVLKVAYEMDNESFEKFLADELYWHDWK